MPRHPLTTETALKAIQGRLDDSPETLALLLVALEQAWIALEANDWRAPR